MEEGHGRGLASVFGPVRVTRMAYRNRREPNLYPAGARQVLPGDPYSLGMRSLAAFHLAGGGFGQAQEVIEARTGVTVGRAQLAGLAEDLAAWTGDFYEERSRDAEEEEQPDSDVIMMQGDGKGIAMRPEHRKHASKEDGTRPGIKKMAGIVAVAGFTPAVREPQDIAAPPARRQAHPGPEARDKWVSASITESIEDMTAAAFDEAGHRDPEHVRQRVFLVDGNKQQITAIEAQAAERGMRSQFYGPWHATFADVHLGDAELLADLRLGHVVGKAHQQDLLLPQGQLAPVRSDSQHAEHVLHPAVLLAEDIGQGDHTRLASQRRVQRGWPAGYLRLPRLPQTQRWSLPGAGPSRSRPAPGPGPGPAGRPPCGLPVPVPARSA